MLDAEKALWTAVLVQAIDDLVGINIGCHRYVWPRLRYFARLWFESASDELGAFCWIYDLIEIDPGRLRRRLFAIAERNGRPPVRSAGVCAEQAEERPMFHVEQGDSSPEPTPGCSAESEDHHPDQMIAFGDMSAAPENPPILRLPSSLRSAPGPRRPLTPTPCRMDY